MKSVKERYKGMTYAAAAEKVANKYKNRKFDSLEQEAYLQEIKMLMNMQEEVMAKRSAQEFALGKMLTENPQAQEMMQSNQGQQPMMKEGGQFPDRYKKMGFSGVNKPKKTPGASKSHAVVVKDGDNYKLIRFGQQGVSGAGSNPKSDKEKARQKSFKARHAKNIAKGKTSAAYWADKVKWKEGGWIQQAVDKKKLAPGGGLPDTIPPYGTAYGDSNQVALINQVRDAIYTNPINSQFKNIMGATFNPNPKPVGLLDGMDSRSLLEKSLGIIPEKTEPRQDFSGITPLQTMEEKKLAQQQQAQQKADQEKLDKINPNIEIESVQGQGESDSAYDAAIAGSRINKLINAGLILSGPERRAPVFNPMEGDVMNKVNAMSVNLDPVRQSIQSSANAAINRLSNLSRSAGNLKSNIANIYASMNTNLANVDMQQQQQLNQIRQSQASILNNLGVNRQQSISAAKEINDRNRAAWQNEISKFGAAILDDGKFFTRMEVQKGQNLLMSKILSDSFADFNLNPDLMAKISEGRYGDITSQELITLEKTLPENKFQTFAQVYGQETGKEVKPSGQAATDDKKKSGVMTQEATTSTQQQSNTPGLPQASREQVQQAVNNALSARTGNAPASAPATTATTATTQDPGKQMDPPRTSFSKTTSAKDMDQAIDQILEFEAKQGSSTGTGLSNYGISSLQNPTKEEAKEYIKTNIAPLVKDVPGSIEEKRSLMDHWFNSGTDGRIYAYQEYLRRTDPNNTKGWKDAEGKWKDRNKFREATKRDDGQYGYTDQTLEQEMTRLYNSIPTDQRRAILKSGRDWYYQNTNVGSGAYEASWKDRVEETGD